LEGNRYPNPEETAISERQQRELMEAMLVVIENALVNYLMRNS
jgi:hypothetical protein